MFAATPQFTGGLLQWSECRMNKKYKLQKQKNNSDFHDLHTCGMFSGVT